MLPLNSLSNSPKSITPYGMSSFNPYSLAKTSKDTLTAPSPALFRLYQPPTMVVKSQTQHIIYGSNKIAFFFHAILAYVSDNIVTLITSAHYAAKA